MLFDRTIRENIIYGLENDNISHERIQQVLEQANIKNFIDTLPEVSSIENAPYLLQQCFELEKLRIKFNLNFTQTR